VNDSLLLNANLGQALPAIVSALERYGFCAVPSFDLRSALAALPECACPHHGSEQCTCQYIVLLIYPTGRSPQAGPIILTLHAHDTCAPAPTPNGVGVHAQCRCDQTQVALVEPAFGPALGAEGEVTPYEQVVIALIATAYALASPHPAAVTPHVSI